MQSTPSMMGSMTWRKPDSGLMECYVKRICQETVCVRPGSYQVCTALYRVTGVLRFEERNALTGQVACVLCQSQQRAANRSVSIRPEPEHSRALPSFQRCAGCVHGCVLPRLHVHPWPWPALTSLCKSPRRLPMPPHSQPSTWRLAHTGLTEETAVQHSAGNLVEPSLSLDLKLAVSYGMHPVMLALLLADQGAYPSLLRVL